MSPIRKTAPGVWAYRCLECGATEGDYTSDNNALYALTDHWKDADCVQDGVIQETTERQENR